MKFKFINQLESNDCGPACLAMISNFHGVKIDLEQTKNICSVTRMGVSVRDILDGGEKIGLESTGLKLKIEDLTEIPLPAILFWKQDHFVVLKKITSKNDKLRYHLSDPGYGSTIVHEDILKNEWIGNNVKGVCLVFQQPDDFSIPLQQEQRKRKNTKALLNQLTSFLKQNKLKYFLSLLFLIFGLASNWVVPIIFKKVIDDGIIAKSLNLVFILLMAQLLLFIGNFGSRLFSDFLITKFNFKLSISLKEKFLRKLIKLPINYFDTRLNTDTLLRLSDLTRIQEFLTWKGVSFIINILNLVAFSLILLYLNTNVFYIYLFLSVLSVIWVAFFLKKRAIIEYSMFIRQSDNSNNLYEFIMNMPEIKVNQAQEAIISKITSLQEKLNKLELRSLFLNMYQLSGANFILKLKELTVIAYCAYLIIQSQMTVGTLLSISYIIGQLSAPIINLINNFRDVQDAQISNKRIQGVYDLEDENDNKFSNDLPKVEDIILEGVSFKYPGSFNPFVLKDLSFKIPKNKITAIVGVSGSGKTTLMKLLMRYYNPNTGKIFLKDKEFDSFNADDWRKKCGVVLQNGHIFSGTIKYNIGLTENELIDEREIKKAIKAACLDDFISTLPLGLETKIGNIGMQLSGGQSQRVLIARAIYKNPEFIFFDEATSSLDANTEKSILNNLNTFFKGRTVLVVAHRLSTVKHADQIIVIDEGKLIEIGNHSELIESKKMYYSLVKNQLDLEN